MTRSASPAAGRVAWSRTWLDPRRARVELFLCGHEWPLTTTARTARKMEGTMTDKEARLTTDDGHPANQLCPHCKVGWLNAYGHCEADDAPYAGRSFFVSFDRDGMAPAEVAEILVALAVRVEMEGLPMVQPGSPCTGQGVDVWRLGAGVAGAAYTADDDHGQD